MIDYFLRSRGVLGALIAREIKQRYKQSVLGLLWVIVTPLLTMLVLSIVFSQIIRVPIDDVPYAIFVYVGLLVWNFFASAVTAATGSLVANANLLTKIYFPRESIVFATIIAKAVDLLVASSVFVLLLVYYQIPISITIFWVPMIIIVLSLLTTGVSLLLAVMNLFYRDTGNVIGVFLLIWMYASPILYPLEIIPSHLQTAVLLNPMTGIVVSLRNIIVYQEPPAFYALLISGLISIVIFVAGFIVFKKLESIFADVV